MFIGVMSLNSAKTCLVDALTFTGSKLRGSSEEKRVRERIPKTEG